MSETRPIRKHGEVLQEFLDLKGKRVLDVGCGDGALARLMTRAGARVTGIECAQGQLDRARAAKPAGEEVYLFGYGESLPLCEDSFDILVYFNALHHVPVEVQPCAMQEAARVLKPSGLLYIQEPIAEGPYFELTRKVDDETEVRAKAYKVLREAVAKGWFTEEAELEYITKFVYRDVEDFLDRIVAVDENRREKVSALESSLREAFLASAERQEEGYCFNNPARVNLLRRA